MKRLLPFTFAVTFSTALLCGCPDTKMPKAPPKIPEPKAQIQHDGSARLAAQTPGMSMAGTRLDIGQQMRLTA